MTQPLAAILLDVFHDALSNAIEDVPLELGNFDSGLLESPLPRPRLPDVGRPPAVEQAPEHLAAHQGRFAVGLAGGFVPLVVAATFC